MKTLSIFYIQQIIFMAFLSLHCSAVASKKSKNRAHATFMRGEEHFKKEDATHEDLIIAVQLWKRAAQSGHRRAVYRLVEHVFLHETSIQDHKEALKWLQKAAARNNYIAMHELGQMYRYGMAVDRDFQRAAELFRKAAEGGGIDASMYALGKMYKKGMGVKTNDEEAFRWFQRAVAKNNHLAMYELGTMYLHGIGIKQDVQRGLNLLQTAANWGHFGAMYKLGIAYKKGEVVAQDYRQAISWFTRMIYGPDVARDNREAFHWFKKNNSSEREKYYAAMFELGQMYLHGHGIPRSEKKGQELLRTAKRIKTQQTQTSQMETQAAQIPQRSGGCSTSF